MIHCGQEDKGGGDRNSAARHKRRGLRDRNTAHAHNSNSNHPSRERIPHAPIRPLPDTTPTPPPAPYTPPPHSDQSARLR